MRNFTIYNDSKFEPGRCSNGGCYGFWATYHWVAQEEEGLSGHYDREFHATHELGLCENCDGEMHEACTSQVTIEEVLSDLLTAISRLGEKAAHFNGPAFRITVSEWRNNYENLSGNR